MGVMRIQAWHERNHLLVNVTFHLHPLDIHTGSEFIGGLSWSEIEGR